MFKHPHANTYAHSHAESHTLTHKNSYREREREKRDTHTGKNKKVRQCSRVNKEGNWWSGWVRVRVDGPGRVKVALIKVCSIPEHNSLIITAQ